MSRGNRTSSTHQRQLMRRAFGRCSRVDAFKHTRTARRHHSEVLSPIVAPDIRPVGYEVAVHSRLSTIKIPIAHSAIQAAVA